MIPRSTALALTALTAALSFGAALDVDGKMNAESPRLVLGVLGDMHVRAPGADGSVPPEFSADKVRRILLYFRERQVDGVICTGDIADRGSLDEFKAFADVWYGVFPDNRRSDGATVEKLFVFGDHDVLQMMNWTPETAARRAELWERVWHEPYCRFVRKEVKGYVFLGAHFENSGYKGEDLERWLASEAAKTDPSKPFFYAQHRHLTGTCYSPFGGDVCGGGTATARILSAHPNALAFSGHSHYSLTEEAGFWRGSFTSLGTGAAAYNLDLRRGRENGDYESKERKAMPPLRAGLDPAHPLMVQGSLLTVWDDRITVERREFVFGEKLGPDWTIPWPPRTVDPKADWKARGEAAAADRLSFLPGGVKIVCEDGVNRQKEREKQIVVSFPSAVGKGDNRAWDYEVRLETPCGDWDRLRGLRRVQAPDFYLPKGHEPAEVSCAFSASELRTDGRVFLKAAVTVIDPFGNRHAVLESPVRVITLAFGKTGGKE